MKKMVSVLLVLTLLISGITGIPQKKRVKALTEISSVNDELKNPSTDSNGVTSWDSVYFGNYWQDDTNGDGFANKKDEKVPIKWRVLSVQGDEVLLLADKCLEYQPLSVDEGVEEITWENCSIRKWLNEEFYNTAFSNTEKTAIIQKTLSNQNDNKKFVSCEDTKDKVALLSWDEAYREEYALTKSPINLETRYTKFAKQEGLEERTGAYAGITYMCTRTYTRSKKYSDGEINLGASVKITGRGNGFSTKSGFIGIRPIIYIKKSSLLWKKESVIHNFEMDNEPMEQIKIPEKGTPQISMPISEKNTIIHSGKDGDISWSIDSMGCLRLEGNGDWEGLADDIHIIGDSNAKIPQWLNYCDEIVMAKCNISGMTNCKYMFDGCHNLLKIESDNWDTSQVLGMSYMFRYCSKLQSLDILSEFDTSQVTSMEGMFYGCEELAQINLDNFITSNVTNMWGMFAYCTNLEEIDLSSFSTINVKSMGAMFGKCDMLKKLNLSSFDLTNCKYFSEFDELYNLVEIETPCQLQDIFDEDHLYYSELPTFTSNYTPWRDENGNIYNTFPLKRDSVKLTRKIVHQEEIMPFCGVDGSLAWNVDLQGKLTITGDGKRDTWYDYPKWHIAKRYIKSCVVDVKGITDASYMFADLPYLERIVFNGFETLNAKYMDCMFRDCFSLKYLNIRNFSTEYVGEVDDIFSGCLSLSQIRTPVNLKMEIKLPQGNWTDESGKKYIMLPVNESESFLLKNSDKPQYEWEDDPTPTASPSATPAASPSATPTASPSATPTASPSATPTASPSATPTPSPTPTPSATVTPTPTNTPSVSDKSVSVANVKVTIKSVKNKKGKKVIATWKKVTGARGYQIAYSTNKKFKSKKIKNVTKTTVTLSNLKKKKIYYIKVRAYTKVNGKKIYSKWSEVKKVKIKK